MKLFLNATRDIGDPPSRATGWPLTPKVDTATWAFLGLSDMGHGL